MFKTSCKTLPVLDFLNYTKCSECGGKGIVTIYNAYNPEYKENEICDSCNGVGYVVVTSTEESN